MKYLVIIFFPALSFAQKAIPRLEGDTLYTSNGYNFYKGQTLHILVGTARTNLFRFIRGDGKNGDLTNSHVTIRDFRNFRVSNLGNAYINLKCGIIYKDGSKGGVTLVMNFDRAMAYYSEKYPNEIEVPDQFKKPVIKGSIADEIKKLKDLLDTGAITQEEYDMEKKKLLNQ